MGRVVEQWRPRMESSVSDNNPNQVKANPGIWAQIYWSLVFECETNRHIHRHRHIS